MKKPYIIIVIGLAIVACKPHLSQTLKEQAAIKIKGKLSNPNSYDPVSWDTLHVLNRSAEYDADAHRVKVVIDSLESVLEADTASAIKLTEEQLEQRSKRRVEINSQIIELRDLHSRLPKNGDSKQVGWFVLHRFKTKGKWGASELKEYAIDFNIDLTKVDSVEDISQFILNH